jgi:hypothetical protein
MLHSVAKMTEDWAGWDTYTVDVVLIISPSPFV